MDKNIDFKGSLEPDLEFGHLDCLVEPIFPRSKRLGNAIKQPGRGFIDSFHDLWKDGILETLRPSLGENEEELREGTMRAIGGERASAFMGAYNSGSNVCHSDRVYLFVSRPSNSNVKPGMGAFAEDVFTFFPRY